MIPNLSVDRPPKVSSEIHQLPCFFGFWPHFQSSKWHFPHKKWLISHIFFGKGEVLVENFPAKRCRKSFPHGASRSSSRSGSRNIHHLSGVERQISLCWFGRRFFCYLQWKRSTKREGRDFRFFFITPKNGDSKKVKLRHKKNHEVVK